MTSIFHLPLLPLIFLSCPPHAPVCHWGDRVHVIWLLDSIGWNSVRPKRHLGPRLRADTGSKMCSRLLSRVLLTSRGMFLVFFYLMSDTTRVRFARALPWLNVINNCQPKQGAQWSAVMKMMVPDLKKLQLNLTLVNTLILLMVFLF